MNIAYRWFCGLNLDEKVPDHSLFSQNRKRRFTNSKIIKDIFNKIVTLRGYDVGAVHRGLEILGITGYCSSLKFYNTPQHYGFTYDFNRELFICPMGQEIVFERIIFKKRQQNYARIYSINRKICKDCGRCNSCLRDKGSKKIFTSAFYPAFYANQMRNQTPIYKIMKKLRSIWSEGTFSVLKREHNLKRAQKRGIERVKEQCLLAAMALNLKRMVPALTTDGPTYILKLVKF